MKSFNSYLSNFSFRQHNIGINEQHIQDIRKNFLNKVLLNKQEVYDLTENKKFDIIMPDSESYIHLLAADSTFFQVPVPFTKTIV